jgi:Icc protein
MMATPSLRLVQLSDCHLAREPGRPYRGIDAHAHLERVLQQVREASPQLLLATGDLSEDGSAQAHAWLAARLATLEVPLLALAGNHDDPAVLCSSFPASPVAAPWVHDSDAWRLVLLNSVVPGEVPGRIGADMLAGLDAALAQRDCHQLVALHHQPVPVGSPWIDRYPLLNAAEFWAVLERHPGVRAVVWGHVHQGFDQHRGKVRLLSCPSTASNSLPGQEKFTRDPAGPGCRWLELSADGAIDTGLLFAGAS